MELGIQWVVAPTLVGVLGGLGEWVVGDYHLPSVSDWMFSLLFLCAVLDGSTETWGWVVAGVGVGNPMGKGEQILAAFVFVCSLVWLKFAGFVEELGGILPRLNAYWRLLIFTFLFVRRFAFILLPNSAHSDPCWLRARYTVAHQCMYGYHWIAGFCPVVQILIAPFLIVKQFESVFLLSIRTRNGFYVQRFLQFDGW